VTPERESEHDRPRQGSPEHQASDAARGARRSRTVNSVVAGVAVLAVVGAVGAATVLGTGTGTGDVEAGGATDVLATQEAVPTGTAVTDGPGEDGSTAAAVPTEGAPTPAGACAPAAAAAVDPVQFDAPPPPVAGVWTVSLATTCGPVTMELDGRLAPQGVGNLVFLAQQGWFDGTPCHRLTTTGIFVLQCGDPTGTGTGGPGYAFGPVENAPADDLYPAGTVAMARVGGDGESMGSQFFLVYEDSTIPSDAAGGYTVLGHVTEGLDVVQQVAAGGLAADGVAPALSIAIDSVIAEESA